MTFKRAVLAAYSEKEKYQTESILPQICIFSENIFNMRSVVVEKGLGFVKNVFQNVFSKVHLEASSVYYFHRFTISTAWRYS